MAEARDVEAQIKKLEKELDTISRDLQRAIDHASENIWVKNGQVVPGLAALHHRVTTRTDEIMSQILELRRKLYGGGEEWTHSEKRSKKKKR
jgi:hypothetical protein